MEPVSIDTSEQEIVPVSIDTNSSQANPLSPEIATLRATKANLGMASLWGDRYGELYDAFSKGYEDTMRQTATATIDQNNAVKKRSIIVAAVRNANNDFEKRNIVSEVNAAIPPANVASVFEQKYAERAIGEFDEFAQRDGDTFWNKAYEEIPVVTQKIANLGVTSLARVEFSKKLQQDAIETLKKQSNWGYAGDIAKDIFSLGLYSEGKLRAEGLDFFKGLLGTNLEISTRKDLALPEGEYQKVILEKYNRIKADNPSAALHYATALVGQSISDQSFDDIQSALNLGSIWTLGSGVFKTAKHMALAAEVRAAVKDQIKNVAHTPPTKASLAEGVGDMTEAAVQRNADMVERTFKGTNRPAQDALEMLPTGLRADVAAIEKGGDQGLSSGLTNIVRQDYDTAQDKIMGTIANMQQVMSVPFRQASEDVFRELAERAKKNNPGIRNAILDVSDPVRDPFSNTFNYDIKVGNFAGTLFSDEATAAAFAQMHGLEKIGMIDVDKAALARTGLGYFIRVNAPLDVTDDIVRDLLKKASINQTPQSGLFRSALSWVRTPEDTLSQLNRMNRHAVTYAKALLTNIANEERELINAVKSKGGKKQWEDLERTLKNDQLDKDIKGQPGRFFESISELQDFYQFVFKRMPEDYEVRAYFAHKRLVEMDRIVRTIELYRNKSRLGAQNWTVAVKDADGKVHTAAPFDGVERHTFPGGDDSIMVVGDLLGGEQVYKNSSKVNKKTKETWEGLIKRGEAKVIEIYNSNERPFQEFGDKAKGYNIRWVITKNVEQKPLSWDQLPRRGGGHFEYEYDHYIKQAKIRPEFWGKNDFRHWYEGDTTVMPIALRQMGHDLVAKLNPVIELMDKKGAVNLKAAEQLFKDSNLPIEWKEFRSWFIPSKVNGKDIPPRLNTHEPLVVVPRDTLIVDMNKDLEERYPKTFKDGTRQGSLASQFQVKFTGERDAWEMFTINNEGTRHNPIYKYEPADLVDPLPMMNRSLSRILNSQLADDYKMFSVESWIREAGKWLEPGNDELKYSPYKHFYRPIWKDDTPLQVKSALLANRFKIQQFLGQPTITDKFAAELTQNLSDTMYDKIGPKAAMIPQTALPITKDPVSFVRGMVYHMKMGLFALPQLITNSMTYVNIAAHSPLHAPAGSYGALLHQWARINPDMVEALDNWATKLNMPGFKSFKAGEWKEAREQLERTGFEYSGAEHIYKDRLDNFRLVQTKWNTFLDWGQMFFKGSDRFVRQGAWYTAFKEFREANPTGRITELERAQILERADILANNMSRASASAMHSGVFSLTSQFLSYQMRLAEVFFSKRIGETVTERALARARIMATYSAAFGVPSALGVTGFPFGEYLRKNALEQGYVVGDNWLHSLAMEGIPALVAGMATGNWYNIGERYGAQGFEQLKEALRGDKPWWTIVGGASFGTFHNMFTAGDGFVTAISNAIKGTGEFKFKPEDFLDPLKEIQSVNSIWHAIAAINTGNWLSKKEYVLGQVSPLNAVFMSAFGLQPQDANDVFTKTWSIKDREEMWKYAENKFTQEFRRGLQAADDKNEGQAKDYMKRAFVWLHAVGYPEENFAKIIAQAADRHQDLIARTNWKFYLHDVPEAKKLDYLRTYPKTLQGP